MANEVGDGVSGSFSSLEDNDRKWLVYLFASLAREDEDLNTLLARRAEREMKARPIGFQGRNFRSGDGRRSPGRRLSDFLDRPGSGD